MFNVCLFIQKFKWQWAYLHAQYTLVKVHILIETVFQIRCLYAQQFHGNVHINNMHIIPGTHTTGGISVMIQVSRHAVVVHFQQKHLSIQGHKHSFSLLGVCIVFSSSASQFDGFAIWTHKFEHTKTKICQTQTLFLSWCQDAKNL